MPDRYTLVSHIASGGFGRVDRVIDTTTGESVARKTFEPDTTKLGTFDEDKLRQRFVREVRTQQKLGGDYVMPILDFDLSGPSPWFTMPMASKSYQDQIDEDKRSRVVSPGPLADILAALEFVHRRHFVHRDLKPSNILFHDGKWKLCDFGLVSPNFDGATSRFTSVGSGYGSLEYMSPEQHTSFSSAGEASDIYSFGCILHDLVGEEGRLPFAQHTAPGRLGSIIERCTDRVPARRFRSIDGLRTILFAVLVDGASTSVTKEADQWHEQLKGIGFWTESTVDEFIRFLRSANDTDKHSLFMALDADHFSALAVKAPDIWEELAESYAAWVAERAFPWWFCDVLAGRLKRVFDLVGVRIRSEICLATAELASSHNRWHVMDVVFEMCGPNADLALVNRLSVDISATEAATKFARCASQTNRTLTHFHPIIQGVVDREKRDWTGLGLPSRPAWVPVPVPASSFVHTIPGAGAVPPWPRAT